jgi:hypothetical protein
MNKIWCVQTPVFGSVLLMSVLSQTGTATAAGLPASQPAPTPGIATPDQAVRQMAASVVIDSRAAAAAALKSSGDTSNRVSSASRPLAANSLPVPSRLLSNCPNNTCGFVATQPPVSLGTVAPSGISKVEQNKLISPDINNSLNSFRKQSITSTPSEPIENAAKAALGKEIGENKDGGKEKSVAQPVDDSADKASALTKPTSQLEIASNTNKSIGVDLQQQITFFKDRLVEGSRQFITVLPKPQIDSSLLNIGSGNGGRHSIALSSNSRLTLGSIVHQDAVKSWGFSPALAQTNTAAKSFSILPALTKPLAPAKSGSFESSSTNLKTLFFANIRSSQPTDLLLISSKL